MNRAERREFVKRAKKRGISEEIAEAYLSVRDSGTRDFGEGDKVRLNVQRIQSQKGYQKMSARYKEFVEANVNTVFTAHIEQETLVSLKEQPEWLFWSGHLIKVEAGKAVTQNPETE